MVARIYKPTKTAMQSGRANTRDWTLDFAPADRKSQDPLMGWTSSGDTPQQVRLTFATKEEAVAYCERNGIPYQITESKAAPRHGMSYADNFAFTRRGAWTH